MTQCPITFGFHAMDHVPDEELPAVSKAGLEVVQAAKTAIACRRAQEVRVFQPAPEV
jgi:hypothetical protein